MALEILKCPNCGARVPASVAGAVASCEFCGAVLSGLALRPPPAPVAPPPVAPAPAPVAAPAPAPVAARVPAKVAAADAARASAKVAARVRPSARATSEALDEASILDLARRALGSRDSLYFDGNIPSGKLKAAHETHGASIGRVLVQYDDTLFGGADDGFVMTGAALHWKNLAEEPRALRWGDIDPDSVDAVDGAVSVGDQKIDIVLEEGKPMIAALARLISDLARWARGDGPPND